MRAAFELVRGRQEERRDSSKGDTVQGITQVSLAEWSMGKDNHPTDVRRKGGRDEESEVAALRLENAILKAEVEGLRATVAFLTTSTGQLPCLNCGNIRSAPEKGPEAKQARHLSKASATSSATSSMPRRPGEASSVQKTGVHSSCQIQSAPKLAPSRIIIRENVQTRPAEPVQRVQLAEASCSSANVTPLCVPVRDRASSSLPGDTSRSDSTISVEAHDSGPVSAPDEHSKCSPKPAISCTSPHPPVSIAELCAKCLPLRVGVPPPRTLREEASQEATGFDCWSEASTSVTPIEHAFAKCARENGDENSGGGSSESGIRVALQRRRGSHDVSSASGRVEETGAAVPRCGVESGGEIEQQPISVLYFCSSMKDVDEEERDSHCTVCTFCAQRPTEDKPVSLCKGCPRIFCMRCLPEEDCGATPVQCPMCPGDVKFSPAAPGVDPKMHLLRDLIGHDLSHSFRENPSYMKTAVRSMDLGIMMGKLKSGKYSGRRAWGHFQKDCNLIWENCRYYNDCDELGLPDEGTVVPCVVRCALVLEAMATKFFRSYIPDQQGSSAATHPDSSPVDLQTWDAHRQKVQQAKAEARLKQVASIQSISCNGTTATGSSSSEMTDDAISVATGTVSIGSACAFGETTSSGRSHGAAHNAPRGKEMGSAGSSCLQGSSKKKGNVGRINTVYRRVAIPGGQRTVQNKLVDGMRQTNSDGQCDDAEIATSCGRTAQEGGGAGVGGSGSRVGTNQRDQSTVQTTRPTKAPSLATVAPTSEAKMKRKRLSQCVAPVDRSSWKLLDQLGDVAYGFPKKRK